MPCLVKLSWIIMQVSIIRNYSENIGDIIFDMQIGWPLIKQKNLAHRTSVTSFN
jgi:hypothetical protein